MAPVAVAVADGQRLLADALVRGLQPQVDLDVSPECSTTGREIVSEVVRRAPDVALIDFWITDMAGPAAARTVLKVSPSTRVVFLAEFFVGPPQRDQAQKAGALGFLGKNLGLDEVADAIRCAAATPVPLKEWEDLHSNRVERLMTLTSREIELLQVLRRGLSPRQAADELSISPGTVKNHVHKILRKVQVSSLVEAMLMAEDEGFISWP